MPDAANDNHVMNSLRLAVIHIATMRMLYPDRWYWKTDDMTRLQNAGKAAIASGDEAQMQLALDALRRAFVE